MRNLSSVFLVTSVLGFCSCTYDFGFEQADDTGPNIGIDSESLDTRSETTDVDTESESKEQTDTSSEIDTSSGIDVNTDSVPQSDSDSASDTETDLCPDDPQKTEPGVCGCGQPETCGQLINTSKSAYNAFENIVVSYHGLPGNEWDWVGLYHPGASNDNDLGYGFTFGQTSGTMDFGVLSPGDYEARLFYDDSYDLEFSVSFIVRDPQTEVVEILAVADTYADETHFDTNFGTATTLLVDDSPERCETFVKFDIDQLPSQVQSVWLGLFFVNGSEIGPDVYPTGSAWTENGLTWNNRPSTNGALIDAMGIVCLGWRFIDITSVITQAGTYSFSLTPNSSDGVDFGSRESANKPKIVFVTGRK